MTESPSVSTPSSVLIAGCGYVGLRAARLWQSRGIQTFAITRHVATAEQWQTDGIRPIVFDLGSSAEWPALPDVDVILWSVGFDRSPGSNRRATWIDGLRRFLSTLPSRTEPRRIIYASSTGVYGEGDGHTVDELTLPNPTSEGGIACQAAEQILQEYAACTGTFTFILRLAGIYGPDRLLRRVSELRERVPLTTPPDEWLNLVHVNDAVRAIDFAATTNEWPRRDHTTTTDAMMMNVVAAGSVTRRTYYSMLAQLVSAPEPIFRSPTVEPDTSAVHHRRGGNRRVVSCVRPTLPVEFLFDDCAVGLAHAVAESTDICAKSCR